MSDALNYLLKARPEAMQSYFKFLKEAGKSLHPKTKAIISVITKVDNQTEAGFRQYLKRALQEGVSANEILDALLLAFPTLGLTKIIWAVDILLAMDLPEFRLQELMPSQEWHDLGMLETFKQDQVTGVKCDGHLVFVYAQDGAIRVYDNICPHQATHIPEQALTGYELTCPKHKWKFDLKSGECIENGDRPLRVLDNRIENSKLMVYW